jgi:hypothetical protein
VGSVMHTQTSFALQNVTTRASRLERGPAFTANLEEKNKMKRKTKQNQTNKPSQILNVKS